jgi:hypothetical protein
VANGVKCGPHGGKNGKMKSRTVSWSSHKIKVEPGLRGSRVMGGDRRRLHQVGRVCSGSPENHRVSAEPQSRGRRPGVAVKTKPANPVLRTGLTGLGSQGARSFEAKDTSWDPSGIRPMVLQRQFPKVPLVGVYYSLGFRVFWSFGLPPYNPSGRGWQPSLGTLAHFDFPIFPSYFP